MAATGSPLALSFTRLVALGNLLPPLAGRWERLMILPSCVFFHPSRLSSFFFVDFEVFDLMCVYLSETSIQRGL